MNESQRDPLGEALAREGFNGKRYTLRDTVKTKKHLDFLNQIIDQSHAEPSIRAMFELDNETPEQTKDRFRHETRFANSKK